MANIKTPEMAIGDLNRVTITMSAHQWEGIAAAQQYRLFAIYDIAAKAQGGRDERYANLCAIRDLCRLPHRELVKKGLLS